MGKGIILRVANGTELPAEITSALSQLIPGYVLESYEQSPDYKRSITRRINSLHDAFLFVLNAYPLDPAFTPITADTLKAYVEECKNECDLKNDSLDDLHKELEKFTAKLVDVLATCWKWEPKDNGKTADKSSAVKQAIACLNEGECYNLMMQHGRPDIATLTTLDVEGGVEYVLQYDEILPPHYEQLITELEAIKTRQHPQTPAWFRKLPEYQQAYFCNLQLKEITPTTVVQDLNKFILAWEDIKNKSANLITELTKIHANSPPFPKWYNELNGQLKEMIKVLALKPDRIKTKLVQFKSMLTEHATNFEFKKTLALVPAIPQWYWVLSRRQQSFLGHVLKHSETVEDAVATISSRNRGLPLPANFGAHSLKKINAKGEVVDLFGRRYRSSHVATRDGLKFPEAVQQRHCDANFAKVTEAATPGKPCLMQTLISPIHAVDYVPSIVTDYLPELPPDLELYKIARAAVARSKRVADTWQHNHPFNIAKLYYYTQANDPDSLAILEKAQKYVATTPGLQDLLDDYKSALESPTGSATFWDYDGRELFLSSMEHLIILTIGGFSYGSCVSGKDRKALELMHTDAMLLYKSRYGSWPKFGESNKEDRIRFVNIFVDLYISRHQHELAGQNAPGSEGIKTPAWYLPKDIVEAINKRFDLLNKRLDSRALEYDDRLATDNEVKNISKDLKSYFLPENELLCKLMARQLGEATCTTLYNALGALINEVHLFKKVEKGWLPTWYKEPSSTAKGIDAIRAIMFDEHAGKKNTQRLAKIFGAILKDTDTGTLTPATTSVYAHLRNIANPKSNDKLDVLAEIAVKEWELLFEKSKTNGATVGLVY
ncbi:oxidoreductase [Legionella maioricensis]|uniref:Oxidoreductase n=1 Tax=Legionella maioricensis TaxID=2896528 RepID=A0A9X2D1H6_9GAMM|nr:oxidoreductase [Legionella maioricensis]MCL9684453.1 oxidoreductase [Legionella maioricensis]MCL9688844.1 oxidoreductase [Legionella maioricensis]